VAEVGQSYPRLLAWLSEGQVGLWNVFGTWVSVLRLIPVVRWLLWRLMFRRVAEVAPWRAALYAAILQQKRSEINFQINVAADAKGSGFEGTQQISRSSLPGLSAVTEDSVVLPTRARRDLHARVATMSSGCIGISGLRGAGKSTLIQDFCAHRYGTPREPAPLGVRHVLPGLRIMVRAPLRFEPRDFLIHQYTCLCRAVLADVRFNPTTLARQLVLPFTPGRVPLRAVLGTLSGVVFLAGCAVLGYLAAGGGWPSLPDDLTSLETAGAVVAGLAGMAAVGWRTRQTAREIKQIVNLASDADDRLTRLHYQRTDSRTAGGTLSAAPAGISAGVSVGTGRELTQQLMTLPELIDDYRDFVQRVVGGLKQAEAAERKRALREQARKQGKRSQRTQPGLSGVASSQAAPGDAEADVRLVIGIDQLDQIDDPGAACRFLDELSAEFGTPNCVYLLSIAARTMAAADRRMVPLKTSSAGLFDEMIWVEPLRFCEAREMLDARVIGLPQRLIALCYVLSGGLPRELLRVARSVVRAVQVLQKDVDGHDGPDVLDAVIDAVIKDEITALKHRALASAAVDANGVIGLVEKLTDRHWPWDTARPGHDPDLAAVLGSAAPLAPHRLLTPRSSTADQPEASDFAADVCDNFIAGIYFLLTVHGLFKNDKVMADIARAAEAAEARANAAEGLAGSSANQPATVPAADGWPDVLTELAGAGIALGVSPRLAADLVSAARRALREKRVPDLNLTGEIAVPFAFHQAQASREQVSNGTR
jgi:hypothetical protein